MDAARMERLSELLERALDLPPADRAAFLHTECGADEVLLAELESLLEAHDTSDTLFDALAAATVAPAYAALLGRTPPQSSAALQAELEAALGDSYRIERELGGGGMSRVFLAEEIALRRQVVIKVLPGETAVMSGDRFRREIQLAAQLQHPHIAPLITTGSTGRLLYYTMPYVAGESLRARLAGGTALSVRDAVSIWRDVLDALAHAHAHGVIHRDIKPGNILLSGRNALVTDFGIAHALEAAAGDANATGAAAMGTPAYMAPEQLTGDAAADHRADLYAAGLVLHEMLDGRPPHVAAGTPQLLRRDCPPELITLLRRCLAPEPAQRPSSADEVIAALDAIPREPVNVRRRTVVAGAAGLAVVLAMAYGVLRPDGQTVATENTAPSIAVMPLTAADDDAALASGLTEELIAQLGRHGGLRVIGSTSVTSLLERGLTVGQIADSLRVSHLIEGSVQDTGGRVRIQLRLIDARDGTASWAESWNRTFDDLLAVQEDVARAVAGELGVMLTPAGGVATRRHTPDIAAYELYLRGRSATLLRSREGLRQGIDYMERAIAADSGFAAPWASLVWLYLNSAGSDPGDYRIWFDRAEQVARRAVRLDASLPEAHSALGWALLATGDLAAAELSLQRAVALDAGVHRGYEGLARLYMQTGRSAQQLGAARRGLAVDPWSHAAMREMALALSMNDRCAEAIELLGPLKSLTPPAGVAGVIRGLCYMSEEMWAEAIAELRWTMETTGTRAALGLLGYALARSGDTVQARTILDDLLTGRRNSHGAYGIAVVYAGLRDYDSAFAWLERSVEEKSWRVYILTPTFAELHRDPRFARLGIGGKP